MYEKHFGLARQPFAATADALTHYPSTAQENAFKRLSDAIQQQEGFALLTGEAGVGKTFLSHRLLHKFDGPLFTIWLCHTQIANPASFYQALLFDLEQPYTGKTEQELRLQFTDHLLNVYAHAKQTLLLIDEGHLLPVRVLEELRLLGNLDTSGGKAIQVILIGDTALQQTLRTPRLAGLAQRMRLKIHLTGMDAHEAVDYLLYHVRAAGGRAERIFTEEAMEALARGSRGIPRLLNQAAHTALQLTYSAEQNIVDAEAVVEALAELGMAGGADQEANVELQLKPASDGDWNAAARGHADILAVGPKRVERLYVPAKRPA